MHLKRNKVPKIWPLERKGTRFLVRPNHGLKNSIPILVVLRDMIKITRTMKETCKVLHSGEISVNGKTVRDKKYPVSLFDSVSLGKKHFKIVFTGKKLGIKEASEKEANEKISKVSGKKMLKGKKTQINLYDGRNYIASEKIKTGDSVVINLKENKISKVLELKEGGEVIFISGKHIGRQAKVKTIKEHEITLNFEGEEINGRLDSLMVIK